MERNSAMSVKPFHLGWFMNFTPDEWNQPFGSGGQPWDGSFFVEMAQAMERACVDLIMIEDTQFVSDLYGGTTEAYLKNAMMAPKHDPAPLAVLMAAATSRIGVVATLSTSFYPPFLLARLCSTVDHIAGGRFGWNIVTSTDTGEARNYGLDKMPEHDLRYDIADEYVDLVCQLWDSWEPDAVVLDREAGVYADFKKVHEINFEGTYFKCRGPLTTVRSPQGRPTFLQAGGSPRGRDFAAKHADAIITIANGVDGMKAYRDDIRARAAAHGRNPDDVKVLFVITPILGETEQDARDKYARIHDSPSYIETILAAKSHAIDFDLSQFDLDQPLPDDLTTTNASQGSLNKFVQPGSGKTLRQLVHEMGGLADSIELISTPDVVAEKMGEAMDAVGGDGYLIMPQELRMSRRYINEVTDGLIPALQRRGLVRTSYSHAHLRDNLKAF
jgi:FMN-dependent oxidoreductase (nitrilotriacetate monooxygenase family)